MSSSNSRLFDAINQKIIVYALLRSRGDTAISSTCRYRHFAASYTSLPCRQPIDRKDIDGALDIIGTLQKCLDQSCVDNMSVSERDAVMNQLQCLANLQLCPQHSSHGDVLRLTQAYFDALLKTATREAEANENIVNKTTVGNVEILLESINRAPRMKKEREAYEQAASAATSQKRARDEGDTSQEAENQSTTGDHSWERSDTTNPAPGSPKRPRMTPGNGCPPGQTPLPPERPPVGHQSARPVPEASPGAWKHSIDRYEEFWDDLDKVMKQIQVHGVQDLKDLVLFPVLVGRWNKVTSETVEKFYERVTHIYTKEAAIDFFKDEVLRWHPDKLDHHFQHAVGFEEFKGLGSIVFLQALKWKNRVDKGKQAVGGAS